MRGNYYNKLQCHRSKPSVAILKPVPRTQHQSTLVYGIQRGSLRSTRALKMGMAIMANPSSYRLAKNKGCGRRLLGGIACLVLFFFTHVRRDESTDTKKIVATSWHIAAQFPRWPPQEHHNGEAFHWPCPDILRLHSLPQTRHIFYTPFSEHTKKMDPSQSSLFAAYDPLHIFAGLHMVSQFFSPGVRSLNKVTAPGIRVTCV